MVGRLRFFVWSLVVLFAATPFVDSNAEEVAFRPRFLAVVESLGIATLLVFVPEPWACACTPP